MGRRNEIPIRAWEVTQIWGSTVVRSEVFAGEFEVTVGDEPGCDLPMAIEGRQVLLRGSGDTATLCAPIGARGVVAAPAGTVELAGDAAVDVALGEDGRAILEVAGMEVLVRATDAPEKITAATPFSFKNHRFTAASFALHAAFLFGVILVPPTAMSLTGDPIAIRNRLAAIDSAPAVEPLPEWMATQPGPTQGTNEGQPMQGEMGQAGDPNETRSGQLQRRGRADNTRPVVSRLSAEQVRTTGILGVLAQSGFDPTGAIYGTDGEGRDPVTLIGVIRSDHFGPGFGLGGWGPAGTGRGGCPAGANPADCAAGTVGIGRTGIMGSIGGCSAERLASLVREHGRARAVEMCSGGHDGIGIGIPGGGRPRASRVPGIYPHDVSLAGGLSKEAIRRTVRSHMSEIRHCYEQGLRSMPDLAGRVSVRFTVRPDGAVLSSQVAGSTLQSASTEQCMAGAVRRWAFPAAENGGVTVVTYPFVVVPAEGN
jgi:TonB family protein